jgi:hypothetical protein
LFILSRFDLRMKFYVIVSHRVIIESFTGAPRNLVTNFDNTTAIILTCNNSTITTNSYNIYDAPSGVLLGSTSLLTSKSNCRNSILVFCEKCTWNYRVKCFIICIRHYNSKQPIRITSSFDSSAIS